MIIIHGRKTILHRRVMPCSSERLVAHDGDPLHASVSSKVVCYHPVLRTAVVPHRHRVLAPTETAGEIRGLDMTIEKIEYSVALCRFHAFDGMRKRRVDEQRLPASFRVGANHRMFRRDNLLRTLAADVFGPIGVT